MYCRERGLNMWGMVSWWVRRLLQCSYLEWAFQWMYRVKAPRTDLLSQLCGY